ncbi:MAG: cation:proton antiporter subunit C [Clostridia bacterium]|nr:cation:proton antiporter subunit C [Clostridia bacterium]
MNFSALLHHVAFNYEEIASMILFGIGFTMLLFNRNLMKKVLGLNIMDTGVYLFLASMGYIDGRVAPIIVDGVTDADKYINPIPGGLVLTGIVVSVSVTAIMLSLIIRLYERYHSLNLDEIYEVRNQQMKEEAMRHDNKPSDK